MKIDDYAARGINHLVELYLQAKKDGVDFRKLAMAYCKNKAERKQMAELVDCFDKLYAALGADGMRQSNKAFLEANGYDSRKLN